MLNREHLENIYREAYFSRLFELNNFAVNTIDDKPKESTPIKKENEMNPRDFFNRFKNNKSTNNFLKESGVKKSKIEKYNSNNSFEKENDQMSSIRNNNRLNTTASRNNNNNPDQQTSINSAAQNRVNMAENEILQRNERRNLKNEKIKQLKSEKEAASQAKIINPVAKTENAKNVVNSLNSDWNLSQGNEPKVLIKKSATGEIHKPETTEDKINKAIEERKPEGLESTEELKKEEEKFNKEMEEGGWNKEATEIALNSIENTTNKSASRPATEDTSDKTGDKTSSYGKSAQDHYNNIANLLTRQKKDMTGPYLAELAEKDIKGNVAGDKKEDISGQLHAKNAMKNINGEEKPAETTGNNSSENKSEPKSTQGDNPSIEATSNNNASGETDSNSNNQNANTEGNNQNINKTITRTFTAKSVEGTDADGNKYSRTEEFDPETGMKIITHHKANGAEESEKVPMTEEDKNNPAYQKWLQEQEEKKAGEETKENEPQDYRDLQDTWNTDIDKENKKNAGATAIYEDQGDATDKAQREINKAKRKLKKAQKVGGLTAYTVGGGALLMGLMNYKRKMDEWRIRAQQAAAQGLPIPPKPGMVSSMITGGIKGAALGGVVGLLGKHTFLKGVDQSIKESKLNDLYNNDKEFRKTYDTAHSTTDTLIAKKNKIFQDEVKGMAKNVKAGNLYTKYKDVRTIDASLQTQGGLSYWQKQLGMKDATREDILSKVTGMTPEDVKYRYPIRATWDYINRGLTDSYNSNRGPVPSNFSENCIELYNNLHYFAKCFSYLEDISESENEFANWIEMYYEYIQIPENYGMPLDIFLEECILYKSFPKYVIQEIVYNKRRYQINELTQTLFSLSFFEGKTRFEIESQENEKLKATLPLFYKAYAERFGEKAMSFDKFKLKLMTNEFFEPYILEKIRFKSVFDSKLQNFAKQPESVKIDDSNIDNIKIEANNKQFQLGSGHQQVATNLNQNDLNNKIVKNNQTQNNINKQQNNFRKLDETKANVNNNIRDINEKKNIREIQLKEKINRKAEKLNTTTDPNKKSEIKNSMAMDRLKIQDNKKNADMKKNQQQEKLQNAEQKIKQMNQNNQDQQQVQVVNY